MQRRDAPLPATDPFFHDAGTASVCVRQQAHGMAMSQPRSNSYPLDTAGGGLWFYTLSSRGRRHLGLARHVAIGVLSRWLWRRVRKRKARVPRVPTWWF
jgi:hypothetical protein